MMEQGPRVMKTFKNAYQRVIAQQASSGGSKSKAEETYNEMKEKMGTFVNPMTRDEAFKILNIDLEELEKKAKEEQPE